MPKPESVHEEKPPIPSAPPEAPAESDIPDGSFDSWADVLEKLMKYDIPLFGILADSKASIKNGRLIIHSNNPTLYDFICSDTHYKELARSVYEVAGRKMKIAVSKNEKPKTEKSPLENLKAKINNFNSNN